MDFESLIAKARARGASDLHLEPGLPATVRVRGSLKSIGERLTGEEISNIARAILGEAGWSEFLKRGSFDLSRAATGIRCRINVFRTARGVGLAIRLLESSQPSLKTLNLHSDLAGLVEPTHGLVLVSGPTGSGKSSTLAGLIGEINSKQPLHVVTIENPIEYEFVPQQAFIRQRQVGRDTPSFEQGLLDALREDPDVLMVGEMRDPETMRLTLNAAEAGHLVLTTVHSATTAEALQRVILAFSPEIQNSIAAQVADCLVGVVAQRLKFRPDLHSLVPECEILIASTAVRAMIRQVQFYKLPTALETGRADGCWTFARYQEWLNRRDDWHIREHESAPPETTAQRPFHPSAVPVRKSPTVGAPKITAPAKIDDRGGVLEISSADEDLQRIVAELERKGQK